ncbi:methionyl-tRNA formyltransferase [Arcanobacterium haemolyticum]|nr:methionyl-tRNA formyltransferase [Arcanobacterium haemolyticum]
MRILFAGTPEVALPSLKRLLADGHDVAAVLTRAPAPVGRKRILTPSAVGEYAESVGIPVLTPSTLKDEQINQQIRELAPQAVAVVAYGLLIPESLLTVPTHGWINLHFSLLPSWRGAAPVQYAIAGGDDITGASTFRIEKGLDTGPVLGQLTEEIHENDTAGDLLERLSLSGADLLSRTLELLASGRAQAIPQRGDVSLAPTITTADAQVNWENPAVAIDRQIRAHTPAPGAWTTLNGARAKLGPVRLRPDVTDLAPGEIRGTVVGTGSHGVELGRISPPGKKEMDAAAWSRGARLPEGTRFEWKES